MPSANKNFGNGTAQVQGYGQKDSLNQEGTWAAGDQWSAPIASTAGNATLGVGNLLGQNLTSLFTYRDRVYAANSGQFNFSDNGGPDPNDTKGLTNPIGVLGWEVQNPGAGDVSYTTSFGSEDVVQGFSQLQGRIAIFGRRSVQLWTTDADPNNFAWIQTLDNSGTQAPLSILNLGDYDCLYLDDSGVRSLRAKEVTSNAFIDDVGSPVDDTIQAIVNSGGLPALACSVVDPLTKHYWVSIPTGAANTATIFVLSRHPAVKQSAWSTYNPSYKKILTPGGNYSAGGTATYTSLVIGHNYFWIKGANDTSITCGSTTLTSSGNFTATSNTVSMVGTALAGVTTSFVDYLAINFLPQKFVVYQGLIYALGTDSDGLKVWQYGGSGGNLYDGTVVTAVLPWLDDKKPDLMKKAQGIQFVQSGNWKIDLAMSPTDGNYTNVLTQGSTSTPNSLIDSSYDEGRIGVEQEGTHFSIQVTSGNVYGLTVPAVFSAVSIGYNFAEKTT